MKHKKFLQNALTVTVGSVLAKGIGAFYKIPLTNYLGGYGMGLYQMTYPLFCLFLTFSSSGVPSALARLIAKDSGREKGILFSALPLFALLGGVGTLLLCLLAPLVSKAQGAPVLSECYLAIAPSVFLVAILAVFRGYFQGKRDMFPTASSEILEQLVKCAFGLLFASRLSYNPFLAVKGALFAVTLSEGAAVCYLLICYRKEGKRRTLKRTESGVFLLSAVLPVMLSTAVLPLSQVVESALTLRLLGGDAVAQYGLLTGGAISLVNLPVSVCYGLAVACVPSVASSFSQDERMGVKRAKYALALTAMLVFPCALGLFFFAPQIVSVLYQNIAEEEGRLLVILLKTLSPSAVLLACVDTLSACLTGMGRAKQSAISMSIAVCAKFFLLCLFLPNPSVGIVGAAIATNGCYLIAFLLDLYYTIRKKRVKEYDNDHQSWRKRRGRELARDTGNEGGGQGASSHRVVALGKGVGA